MKTDKDGNVRDSFVVRAQSMEGKDGEEQRLRGVEVNLTYMAKGEPGKATIMADQGLYAPTQQKAIFQGHVHVTTEDGIDLKTEHLVYRGDHNSVKSDTHVEFKRKDLSGTAKGFTYDSETGRLELLADVDLKIQDEDNPATLIKSASAEATREEGLMKFLGGVEVDPGPRPAQVGSPGRELLGRGPGHPSRPGPGQRGPVDERRHPGSGDDRRDDGERAAPSHLPPPRPVAASRPHARSRRWRGRMRTSR